MPTPERERELIVIGAVAATVGVGLLAATIGILFANECRGLPFACDAKFLLWVVATVTLPPFLTTLWIYWRKRTAKQH